jgi:hypothetical protein
MAPFVHQPIYGIVNPVLLLPRKGISFQHRKGVPGKKNRGKKKERYQYCTRGLVKGSDGLID